MACIYRFCITHKERYNHINEKIIKLIIYYCCLHAYAQMGERSSLSVHTLDSINCPIYSNTFQGILSTGINMKGFQTIITISFPHFEPRKSVSKKDLIILPGGEFIHKLFYSGGDIYCNDI